MADVIVGRFALIDLIAKGGSGSVWRAWDQKTQELCAAKVLRQRDSADLMRFVREKGVSFDHPHLLTPYGWGAEDEHVVIATKDEGAWAGAEELAGALDAQGLQVLLDDRKASPGIKFKDSELLGVPTVVVVGRGWADGVVELRDRLTGEAREIPVADAAAEIAAAAR